MTSSKPPGSRLLPAVQRAPLGAAVLACLRLGDVAADGFLERDVKAVKVGAAAVSMPAQCEA